MSIRMLCAALTLIAGIAGPSTALSQNLPPGGLTKWEIHGVQEIVSFVLVDPKSPGISIPSGLAFVPASAIGMPEIQEHLKQHPEHAEWAFTIIEIIDDSAFVIDGRSPKMPPNGAVGLWMAEIDPTGFAEALGKENWGAIEPSHGAMLALGLWIPDREYVEYMRERGHYAEYGMVTLAKDSLGTVSGQIKLDKLELNAKATPHGEIRTDSVSGTQIQFAPGEKVENVVVIGGANPSHRDCQATWTAKGEHLLGRGVIVGPTYLTTYPVPLKGSVYRMSPEVKE